MLRRFFWCPQLIHDSQGTLWAQPVEATRRNEHWDQMQMSEREDHKRPPDLQGTEHYLAILT